MLVAATTFPLLRVAEAGGAGTRHGSREFLGMIAITSATGVCAVVGSIGSGGLWEVSHIVSLGTLLLAPLLVPVVVAFRDGMEERTTSMKQRKVHVDKVDTELAEEKEVSFEVLWSSERKEKEEEEVGVLARGEGKGEVGFGVMIRTANFWLYFFTYMFGSTVGLVFLNNLGQIAESHGLAKTSTLVSLASSFGFFGRLVPSLMDYFFSKNGYMVSGPAFMTIIMTPMTGAFFLLLHSDTHFLHVGTAIIGACSGAIASVAVSTTPELFGAKNFAVNHNVVVTNIPVGSFLFGYLAAFLYQREAGGSESCMGPGCYHNTFVIWGSICAFGTLLSFILYIRTKMFTAEETCNNLNTDELSVVV
ncbi:protein NUCLEAR FUSION DEFECTIVE 4 isoform X2 [Iris pallida]|uniref:Protein NUCLEAR FUSION DEFECTIVE 4 isoform X2 n=1 Tax=Iris pallida TaxID=29817 RepID=A0AAX6GQY5_IRIPA|nr:protein NUCLEAR FUSION DEFECTIVE 4 isoform X2 [Iris pallida]